MSKFKIGNEKQLSLTMSNCFICASENVVLWCPCLHLNFSIATFATVYTYFCIHIRYDSASVLQKYGFSGSAEMLLSYFLFPLKKIVLFIFKMAVFPLPPSRHADFCSTSASKGEFILPSILGAEQDILMPRGYFCFGLVTVLGSCLILRNQVWFPGFFDFNVTE